MNDFAGIISQRDALKNSDLFLSQFVIFYQNFQIKFVTFRKLWRRYQSTQRQVSLYEVRITRLRNLPQKGKGSYSWRSRAQTNWLFPKPKQKSPDSLKKSYSNCRHQPTIRSTKPDTKSSESLRSSGLLTPYYVLPTTRCFYLYFLY